jgi:lysozyme
VKTNRKGIDLIKKFEGFRATPYLCPAGYATIGYGHVITDAHGNQLRTLSAARRIEPRPWTLALADGELRSDLTWREDRVTTLLLGARVNENEFSALVSFAYNLGVAALATSTLLTKVRAGLKVNAAEEFMKWVYAGRPKRVLSGLVKRREAERKLFLTPTGTPISECPHCGRPLPDDEGEE